MAAVATGSSRETRDSKTVTTCPMCGQPLLDHDAIERVEHAQAELDRRVESAARVEAAKLAKQIAKRERVEADQKIAALSTQLAGQKDAAAKLKAEQSEALAKQKATHAEELRKLRLSVRAQVAAQAEKDAAAKVRSELRKRDTLIGHLQEQNELQKRRIEHLTADERGEMNEDDLVSALHVAFPDDHVERLGRGRAGSDILHEVRFTVGGKTETAGLIVYECKDTLQWANSFVEQAKKARVTHDTPHVAIISRAFPRSEKNLCVRDDVPVVHPTHLVPLAHVLRNMVIGLHRAELTAGGQASKTQELYDYLSGNEFRQAFGGIVEASSDLTELLRKERTAHEHTWAARQGLYVDIGAKAAGIDGRLRAIIERSNGKRGKVVPLTRSTGR